MSPATGSSWFLSALPHPCVHYFDIRCVPPSLLSGSSHHAWSEFPLPGPALSWFLCSPLLPSETSQRPQENRKSSHPGIWGSWRLLSYWTPVLHDMLELGACSFIRNGSNAERHSSYFGAQNSGSWAVCVEILSLSLCCLNKVGPWMGI